MRRRRGRAPYGAEVGADDGVGDGADDGAGDGAEDGADEDTEDGADFGFILQCKKRPKGANLMIENLQALYRAAPLVN